MIGYCITACFGKCGVSSPLYSFVTHPADGNVAGAHGGGLNMWEVSKEEAELYFKVRTLLQPPISAS